MSKERTGYVYQRGESWIARVTYLNQRGKQRSIRRSFPTESKANKALINLNKEIDEKGALRYPGTPNFR